MLWVLGGLGRSQGRMLFEYVGALLCYPATLTHTSKLAQQPTATQKA